MAVPLMALMLVASSFVMEASAESTSSSYKAEDFVNPQASLSSSGSYELHDSIDYYGGVDTSVSYQQCTGDFAVLEGCGTYTAPPVIPPVVTPPGGGIGAGGDHPDHQDCNQIDCLDDEPTDPTEPTIPENPTTPDKPFELPNIGEPSGQPVPPVNVPVNPKPTKPVVVTPPKNNNVDNSGAKPVAPNGNGGIKDIIKDAGNAVVTAVTQDLLCKDLQCVETTLLRGSALKPAGLVPAMCYIYTFGGFEITWACQDSLMAWLIIILLCLFVLPIALLRKKFKEQDRNLKTLR